MEIVCSEDLHYLGEICFQERAVNIRAVYGFSFTKICEKEVCIAACHLMFPIEYSKRITFVFNNIVIK